MRITIKTKKEEEEGFKKALSNVMQGMAKVRAIEDTRSVLLLNLDPEVEEGEIRGVLSKTLESDINMVGTVRIMEKVNKIRKKSAFVTLPVEQITKLFERKRIGEGSDGWRVRDLVTLGRCFTCRQVGHEAK